MKACVTGGTGFIGSRLALRLREEGHEVAALGRRGSPTELENAREVEERGGQVVDGSLSDSDRLREALAGAEVVFHLAAAQHEANVPDAHFREVNVEGTRRVLEAAEAAGVRRFVLGSTIGVYGGKPGQTVRDDSPLEPDNIYGVTKREGEEVVRSFGGHLPCVIARISETYGPGDRRLLKLFRGARRGILLQVGSAKNLHHLVYVEDLLDGLWAAAREEKAVGRTFVLAGPCPVTTRQMLEAIADAVPGRARILRVPMAPLLGAAALLEGTLRPLGIQPPLHRRRLDFFRKSFSFGMAEAREALGYAPRVELAAGVAATAQWYVARGLL
jgi:nucleoside-diphosphate-sugar epimerase